MDFIQDTLRNVQGNTLNLVLLIFAVYLLVTFITAIVPSTSTTNDNISHSPEDYSWMPKEYPPSTVWRTYTPLQLRPFDGTENSQILFSVNRKVFDVTSGRNFYGPGGPYASFAGRDASRGMAKQSFDDDVLSPVDGPIDSLEDLTPAERDNMREWEAHFTGKYILVGELVDP